MSNTAVLFCRCVHRTQDALHGIQRRVHNRSVKGWRCTVCTAITAASSEVSVKSKGGKK